MHWKHTNPQDEHKVVREWSRATSLICIHDGEEEGVNVREIKGNTEKYWPL